MSDEQILNVIADAVWLHPKQTPAEALAALRDAGYEVVPEGERPMEADFYRCPNTGEWVYRWSDERLVVVPTDTAKLGHWIIEQGPRWVVDEAGVERP